MIRIFVLLALLVGSRLQAQTPVTLVKPDGSRGSFRLKPHPRVWLDGANGPLTAAMRDPDGTGSRKSERASGPLWDSLVRRLERIRPSAAINQDGSGAMLAALGWFMDNRASFADGLSYRKFALDQINHVDDIWFNLGACDKAVTFCGTGNSPAAHTDYTGAFVSYWAFAYSIMRSEMTQPERQAFADKMLNGAVWSQGACENRLEQPLGSGITIGGLTGTGNDSVFDASMVGTWVYLKDPAAATRLGLFAKVQAVPSPSRLTFADSALLRSSSYQGKTFHVSKLTRWAPKQCGMMYLANHHGNVPSYAVSWAQDKLSTATTDTSTTIAVNGVGNWIPRQFPFYLRIGATYSATIEVVKVTGAEGNVLRVVRGQFSTKAAAWPAGTLMEFPSHTSPGDAMGWNNRTLTRQIGHIMGAIALADDDPRAVDLLQQTVDYWRNNTWFAANNYFTITNTATTSYGLSRLVPFMMWVTQSLYASFEPALDYRGDWIKRHGSHFFFHTTTPWDPSALVNWGAPSDLCQTLNDVQCAAPAVWLQAFYPDSEEARLAWFWFRDQKISTNITRLSAEAAERILLPLLLFGNEPRAATSYRTASTHYVGNVTDDDNKNAKSNLNIVLSRTDWNANATLFYLLAPDFQTQEFPDIALSEKLISGVFGDYGIGKQGWFLGQSKQDGSFSPFIGNQNAVDFGPSSQTAVKPWADLEIDRVYEKPDLLYFRTDLTKGYGLIHKVNNAFRHTVHFKPTSGTESIVVYDDYATAQPQRIRGMLHYLNNGQTGRGLTEIDAAGRVVTSDNTKARLYTTFVRISGQDLLTDLNVNVVGSTITVGTYCSARTPCIARFGSKVFRYQQPSTIDVVPQTAGTTSVMVWLTTDGQIMAAPSAGSIVCSAGLVCSPQRADFPDAANRLGKLVWNSGRYSATCPASTGRYLGLEYDHCVGINERHYFLDAGPKTPSAEFLVVHKPVMPGGVADPVKLLDKISEDFIGAQIDSPDPKVAIFGRGRTPKTSVAFDTDHRGNAQFLVSGLSQGLYTVRRGAALVAENITVNKGGALAFAGVAGSYTVQGKGLPLALIPSELPKVVVGQPFRHSFDAEGGEPPYTWTIAAGALPEGMQIDSASGDITGTPLTAGDYEFTVNLKDTVGGSLDFTSTLTVDPADGTLRIRSTTLPSATVGESFSFTFEAAGGVPPYTWQISESDLSEDFVFDAETATISGIPSEVGSYNFTLTLTDQDQISVSEPFVLTVAEPSPEGLVARRVSTTAVKSVARRTPQLRTSLQRRPAAF